MKFKHLFLLVLLLSVVCNVGYFLLGPDAFVTIHDNLDSELSYLALLKNAGQLLTFSANPVVPGVMEGIPRAAFRSPLNVTVWLYAILPPFWVYAVNKLLVHLIGFLGMYLLLRWQVLRGHRYTALACAFVFSMLSYYHIQYGISISGQPLLLWAFLSILRREHRFYHWLVVALFPFYSFMVVTLPFFLPFLAALGAWHRYKTRQWNYSYWLALLLYIGVSAFAEFPLLYATLFDPQFVSHREVWNPFIIAGLPTLAGNIKDMILDTLVTPYHAGSMLTLPVLAALALCVSIKHRITALQGVLLASIAAIVLWASLNDWLVLALMDKVKLIKMLNIDRFNFLLPMLWVLLLATSLAALNRTRRWQKVCGGSLLVLVLLGAGIYDKELRNNVQLLAGHPIKKPTFAQFYAPELFAQLKQTIGQPTNKYKVVTVGTYPNIALFNGLQTLDGYQNNYPLPYKYKFRKIIAPELAKSTALRNYFDYWGSRCYVFSTELDQGKLYPKQDKTVIRNLAIDTGALKSLGGEFLISAVPIAHAAHLQLLKTFVSPRSFWKLYLYQVR
ncbi:DUF6044 family protein [Pontibacter liquoris]|uniref:DUF6044 family protein n=1 Tax=Pontibacter liquoris TaxID=2905677 RepID=UPI001FA6CF7A|nr:DUF6044 family protein [Pontibacter liquoris]